MNARPTAAYRLKGQVCSLVYKLVDTRRPESTLAYGFVIYDSVINIVMVLLLLLLLTRISPHLNTLLKLRRSDIIVLNMIEQRRHIGGMVKVNKARVIMRKSNTILMPMLSEKHVFRLVYNSVQQ